MEEEKQVRTAGGYWVPKKDELLYENEKQAKSVLINLFSSKKEYCYSLTELIKILLEETGYDYSSIKKEKVIPKQSKVLDSIIHFLGIWQGELENKINKFSLQGETYYYSPKNKFDEYYKNIEIKKPKALGLPNHTYFYDGNRNFTSSSKILKNNPCGVYLITNILTNEKYVGQAISIKDRWLSHIFSTDNTRLHQDMRKYGINNFAFTILSYDNPLTLDIDEVKYITKYDSYKNGYNSTPGNIKKAEMLQKHLNTLLKERG